MAKSGLNNENKLILGYTPFQDKKPKPQFSVFYWTKGYFNTYLIVDSLPVNIHLRLQTTRFRPPPTIIKNVQ